MSVRPSTWALGGCAIAAMLLVYRDPWRRDRDAPGYVTNHGATVRLLPELAEGVPTDLELELVRPGGVVTRIAPGQGRAGHWVWDDGASMGPADPDALDGLWSSLRGATTLRAADASADAGLGEGGRIRVRGGGQALEIVLGRATADGVGIYAGGLDGAGLGGGPDVGALWVVERQLGELVAQRAEAWVARRPLLVDVAEVVAIEFADASLTRGPDRLWRSTVGGLEVLLSNAAVEARLGRLLGARLDPWHAPWVDPAAADAPWIRLRTDSGEVHALWQGPACAGDRVALDRGAGLAGCVDARLLDAWPLPGRAGADASWIEPRLAPHDYGRVLRIEQRAPQAMTLRRDGGEWLIERRSGGVDEVVSVGESEVFRWYDALHAARLQTATSTTVVHDEVDLLLTSDSTAQVRLRCGRDADDALACARDGQPAYPVALDVELAFSAETFVDRQLATLSPGEARAIEISGPAVVRQGAHLDLGVWRLDAPLHPEGDAALDDQRVESLLATVSGLRAQEWTAAPTGIAERSLRVERVPADGRPIAVVVELWPGCIARVDGGPAARVGEGPCRALAEDLLVDAPLERAIEDARALELGRRGRRIALRRTDGPWVRVDGEPLGEVAEPLRRWPTWATVALVPGAAPGPAEAELVVEPAAGEPYVLDVGDGWAQIRGEGWFYRLAERPAGDVAVPAPE